MAPPDRDPTHWLYRLDAREWLSAADNELRLAREALTRRAVRPAVTYARRAAGMALNAVLVGSYDERYGRSYMDHLAALETDDRASQVLRDAARALRETPPAPPTLVQIGAPDDRFLRGAESIVNHARGVITAAGEDPHQDKLNG